MSFPQRSFRVALSVLLFATLALATGLPPGIQTVAAQGPNNTLDETPSVTVSGVGRVSVQPDRAVIRLGVETQAEEASEAITQNNQQMQDLIDALIAAAVPEEDIQTQTINLNPVYGPSEPATTGATTGVTTEPLPPIEGQGDEITGYRATNVVQIETDDIDQVGSLIDTAVQAGGNIVRGINFTVSDPTEPLNEARHAAWEQARAQAEQLAEFAGAELGRALSINDFSSPAPLIEQASFDAAVSAVPISPGSQVVETNLQVTWELIYATE
jgi:uncharacterized protein